MQIGIIGAGTEGPLVNSGCDTSYPLVLPPILEPILAT